MITPSVMKIVSKSVASNMSRNKLKKINKRIDKLEQLVHNALHYWKVRCKERATYTSRSIKIHQRLKHVENLEKSLAKIFNRKFMVIRARKKCKSPMNNIVHPVFLSHNETTELRTFLQNYYHQSFIRRVKGKTVPHLTKPQISKLNTLLRNAK